MKNTGKKLNRTEEIVKHILSSRGVYRQIDALRKIKPILKSMGFTVGAMDKSTLMYPVAYTPVSLHGGGVGAKGGEGAVTAGDTKYKPATIYDMLRSYMASVKSLNVGSHRLGKASCPISKFKKNYSTKVLKCGQGELLDELTPNLDMPTMRLMIKRLKHDCSDPFITAALKNVHIENLAYYWLEACMSKVGILVRGQSAKSYDKDRNDKILINPNFIIDWSTDVLNNKESNLDELTIALIATTGRRTSEILKTAIFTKTKSNNTVLFDGQLKQKDREALGIGAGSYIIPVLVDSKLVIKGISHLRKLTKDIDIEYMNSEGQIIKSKLNDKSLRMDIRHTEGVNDKMSNRISSKVKRLFNSPDARPYFLRSAYTAIAKEHGFMEAGEGDQAFRKRLLGHNDYKSQGNYERFELSSNVGSIEHEKKETVCENKANEALDHLIKFDDEIRGNTRAKGMHKLQAHAIKLAESNEIELKQIDATWARKQIVDGKTFGASSVKQWLAILGLV